MPPFIQARELEIGVHWRDWRQLCGVTFLRLEDFLDNSCHQLSLGLLPQGWLFLQVPTLPPTPLAWHPWATEAHREGMNEGFWVADSTSGAKPNWEYLRSTTV